jgi:hypothetical protein
MNSNLVVILVTREPTVVEVSLAHKKLSIDAGIRTEIDDDRKTRPLCDPSADVEFFKSVRRSALPQHDLPVVYES